jgi:hypothetical protein
MGWKKRRRKRLERSMSEEVIPEVEGVEPQKRKYTRRKKVREPRALRTPAPPKPLLPPSLALVEIDSRLAEAIRDRAEAMRMVSELVHWQDRLGRLEQEINSLIGFQQRLTGQAHSNPQWAGIEPLLDAHKSAAGTPIPAPTFSHLNPIPEGVTSVPTKVANPKPSHGNVAATVGGEGGFS